MKVTLYSLVGLLAMAITLFAQVEARPNVDNTASFGIAWAANNAWAPKLANNPHTSVYHHWQEGHVPELSRKGIKFVPMYWGERYNSKWYRLKALFPKYRYTHALFANEPDVSSQSNMSPGKAAALFVQEMVPLRKKYGTKLSSPNICYNIEWLKSFTKIINSRGQHYDFVAGHYYGPVNDFGRFTKYIRNLRAAFPGKNIWITEYGLTQASGPSASSAKNFMVRATEYMAGTGYVKAFFPFGIFPISNPPDSFGAAQNAAFTSNGNLRSIGQYYAYASPHARRSLDESETPRDIRRRHHAMMLRLREHDAEADKDDPDTTVANPTDCDESNERDNCKYLKTIADDHDVDALDENAPLTPEELKELEIFDHEITRRAVVDDEGLDPAFLASLEEEDVVQQP